jgi:acetyl-CoA carboxylase carboxyl transferase subunit alpha
VLEEPVGGAHRDPTLMATRLREALVQELDLLTTKGVTELVEERYLKYRHVGPFVEALD